MYSCDHFDLQYFMISVTQQMIPNDKMGWHIIICHACVMPHGIICYHIVCSYSLPLCACAVQMAQQLAQQSEEALAACRAKNAAAEADLVRLISDLNVIQHQA